MPALTSATDSSAIKRGFYRHPRAQQQRQGLRRLGAPIDPSQSPTGPSKSQKEYVLSFIYSKGEAGNDNSGLTSGNYDAPDAVLNAFSRSVLT